MPFTLIDLLFGYAVPAALAAFAPILLWRPLPQHRLRACVAAVSVVAGFVLGYLLLGLGPLQPATHWHWLPHVLVIALIGPAWYAARGNGQIAPAILGVSVTLAAAFVLVPDWPDLQPSRPVYLACWTLYTAVILLLLHPLFSESRGPLLPFVLIGTLLCGAALLGLAGSLRFLQIAGCGAGAFLGLFCVTVFDRRERWLAAIALPFSLLASGAMLIGETNSFSDVPRFCYYLIPLAPLTLWAGRWRPIEALAPHKRTAVLIALPVAVCLLALIVAAAMESTGESYG